MPVPDFSPVAKAIADAQQSENNFETLSGQNDTAQSNLVTVTANSQNAIATAQKSADDAASGLATGKADLKAKLDAVDAAIAAYEAQLSPAPAA